jgi:uncharacterized membrane protein YgcG
VGLRSGLDTVVKIKNPCPCQELNLGCPACGLVTILTELQWLSSGGGGGGGGGGSSSSSSIILQIPYEILLIS